MIFLCCIVWRFRFSFVEWTDEVLSSKEDSVVNHFRLLGVMEALAAIFKVSFFFSFFNLELLTLLSVMIHTEHTRH